MKKFTKRIATSALLAVALAVGAQTVLTLPRVAQPADASVAGTQQRVASKTVNKLSPTEGLITAEDQAVLEAFNQTGNLPASFAPVLGPDEPEDSTLYRYTGFNAYAGVTSEGNATGGWVNFNLEPFACDTVRSCKEATPYSYVQGDKLYTFAPVYDYSVSGYPTVIRTTFDANTLELLEQKTFTNCNPTGDKSRVPYLLTYDDSRDVVWVISMGDGTPTGAHGATYYLNILDTATCKLKRMGMLGYYDSSLEKGNYSPRGFVAGYGTLYVQLRDDKIYLGKIDPTTLETTVIGSTSMPNLYIYGQQPMIYDSNMGYLLVNHYDMSNGTQYYRVSPLCALWLDRGYGQDRAD